MFADRQVDVVVLVGDLAEDGDLPSLRRALRLGCTTTPAFVVGGNHDGIGMLARALRAEPGTARMIGARGRDVAGVRVAGLPITRRRPGRWACTKRPAVAEWGRGPVVLASHFPVLARERQLREAGLRHPAGLLNRERIEDDLRRRGTPTVVVGGHMHVRDSASAGPILQISCGALVEPPFDATVLTVEAHEGSVTVERRAYELGTARERRNPRMVPARQRWHFTARRGWSRTDRRS